MILFKWGTKEVDKESYQSRYYSHTRWVIDTYHYPDIAGQGKFKWKNLLKHAIGISIEVQALPKSATKTTDDAWFSGQYWDVGIFAPWYIGTRHAWYDGPRHTFSLGFLHFNWMKDDCKKCENDDC